MAKPWDPKPFQNRSKINQIMGCGNGWSWMSADSLFFRVFVKKFGGEKNNKISNKLGNQLGNLLGNLLGSLINILQK